MTHVTCPKCNSNDHTSGYGLAAGPMAAYTFCNGCGILLEFAPDLEGLPEDAVKRIKADVEHWRKEVWGAGLQ